MRLWLIMVLSILITACGFHVRNEADIPPQLKTLYINNANGRSNLTAQLGVSLQQLGVTVVRSSQQAPVTLAIISDNFSQSSSMIGTAQQVNSIILNYNVTYELQDSNGKNIGSPVTINCKTTYLQNASQVLGDTSALPQLEQGLTRDMVQAILSHLGANETRAALATSTA